MKKITVTEEAARLCYEKMREFWIKPMVLKFRLENLMTGEIWDTNNLPYLWKIADGNHREDYSNAFICRRMEDNKIIFTV